MKKTVRDIQVEGKKVLVRCDFNVPMKDRKITDKDTQKSNFYFSFFISGFPSFLLHLSS